ncbi:NAC domain [Quillaja saponaria]|uniref:NAC domain n=1 Tax=Quillaja saponaria TaxID=32244 RepID=A0AAD7LFU2_QUISA|nr:NAC domain [Quillaja saponaria]
MTCMNKYNFVRDGVTRLPPGFRFQPTDEELVFQYLKCKIFSCPLPASIIPEINVCKYDPWDLPGHCEQERYFFSFKEAKYRNGNRMNRTTNSGYWKATGSDKTISCSSRSNDIAGIKKTLVFYEGKSPNGSRTDWVMHEYHLVNSTQNSSMTQIGDRVLCRIFLKKRSTESDDRVIQNNNANGVVKNAEAGQPRFIDFMTVHNETSTSSSCSSSSDITEACSRALEHEENRDYTDF